MSPSAPQAGSSLAELPRTIDTRDDAERLCAAVGHLMDTLLEIVEAETELVRAGKLVAAGELEETKSGAARRYVTAARELQAKATLIERFAPVAIDRLRRRHQGFKALLTINLAALATARQVSEDLLRTVAENVTPPAQQGYGISGRPTSGGSRPSALAVDQAL